MHRTLKSFELFEPTTIDEAVDLLIRYKDEAKVLAGGVDLVHKIRLRQLMPKYVVSLQKIPHLDYVEGDGESGLRLGALTKLRALELYPDSITALNNRGVHYKENGSLGMALVDFDRVIELDGRDRIAYNNRGMTRRVMGEYENAVADFDRAIEIEPRYIRALRGWSFITVLKSASAFSNCPFSA